MALGHLKKNAITALTDATENARKCLLFYEPTRDAVLRMRSWNFATRRVALVELANDEVAGWEYVYALPTLCILVRKVFTDTTTENPNPENFIQVYSPTSAVNAIATNAESAYCEYTYKVVDPNLFDPLFVMALSYELAAVMAPVLTGSASMGIDMHKMALNFIDQASTASAAEGYLPKTKTSSFIEVR
jgi:hypothetical protein